MLLTVYQGDLQLLLAADLLWQTQACLILQVKDPLQQQIQVDWKRWKPEFDENTNDEDDDVMMPGESSGIQAPHMSLVLLRGLRVYGSCP